MQQEKRHCQNCKQEFIIDEQDQKFYGKIQVPQPTFCPECRLIRRLAWCNERTFYSLSCHKCKKPIISIYSPDSRLTVYCSPCWWKDDWDALDYGVDFDLQKPFLVQLRELYQRVPQMTVHGLYTTLVNSDYTHMVSYLKDCYMVTYSDYGENLMYGSIVLNSKDSVDNLMLDHGELCYETVNCEKCYRVWYSLDLESCSDVYFSRNCLGCNNCFGCVNLRNKQHCIFNKPYPKEEYERLLPELVSSSFSKLQKSREKAYAFWQGFPQKYMHGRHNINVTGEYLRNSQNVQDSFMLANGQDCRFCTVSQGPLTDSYDFSHYGVTSSLLYEALQCGDKVSNVCFTWWAITQSHNIEYSMYIVNSHNIFGCVGLKKKKYCILNKQYSKEEYETLRARSIEQMNASPYKDKQGNIYTYGEFFPIELSPFGYNETTAQEFFPLTKDEIKSKGYVWRELQEKNYQPTLTADKIPDSIKDVNESIFQETLECAHKGECNEQCTKMFRIIPGELAYYKQQTIPIPHLCPNCRHAQRIVWRTALNLWQRKCQCAGVTSDLQPTINDSYKNTAEHFHKNEHCPNEFKTSYSPERKEIIYCEPCYLAEVA